jgi:hypothetical protein
MEIFCARDVAGRDKRTGLKQEGILWNTCKVREHFQLLGLHSLPNYEPNFITFMPTGSHPKETCGTDDGKFPVANLKIEHGDFKYQTHTNAIY